MELEPSGGITIASAATNVEWRKHSIQLIDTPGHVDFHHRVNARCACSTAPCCNLFGEAFSRNRLRRPAAQTLQVPRVAFINKCDRAGANPYRVKKGSLCEKLGHNAVLMQVPIGLEEKFAGMVDLAP